jgi:hypothetical protein
MDVKAAGTTPKRARHGRRVSTVRRPVFGVTPACQVFVGGRAGHEIRARTAERQALFLVLEPWCPTGCSVSPVDLLEAALRSMDASHGFAAQRTTPRRKTMNETGLPS